MRRTLIFIILIAICFSVGFAIFYAYNNRTIELDRNDLIYEELNLTSSGNLSGKFKCELNGKSICKYDYYVLDNTLYITFYVTAGEKKALETDSEGYYCLDIKDVGEIKKIYYVDSEKNHSLSFNTD